MGRRVLPAGARPVPAHCLAPSGVAGLNMVRDRPGHRVFELVGSTLDGWADPAVAIAASRAGATGLLNLEHATDVQAARAALERMTAFGRGSLGVKVGAGSVVAEAVLAD